MSMNEWLSESVLSVVLLCVPPAMWVFEPVARLVRETGWVMALAKVEGWARALRLRLAAPDAAQALPTSLPPRKRRRRRRRRWTGQERR